MSKSTITVATQTGQSEWNGKTLTKYFVQFANEENGTLTTGFSDQDKVPMLGEEMEYTITDKGFGNEVRAVKAAFGGGGFKSKSWSPEQISEQNSVKVTCAALEGGKLELKDYKAFYTDCYNWFLTDAKAKDAAPTHMQKAQEMVSNGLPKPPQEESLPF